MPAPCSAFCALSGPRMASTKRLPGAHVAQDTSWSASGRDRTCRGSKPARKCRFRRATRDAGRCLQSLSDGQMALDQHRAGVSAQRERGGVEHAAGRESLLQAGARKERSAPAAAWCSRSCRPGQRRAHQLQEAAARDRIQPLGCALGKFAVQHLLELGAAGQLFQAAPVFRAGFGLGARRSARAGSPDPACPSCRGRRPRACAVLSSFFMSIYDSSLSS